jgi:hypothetical protein
MVYDVAKQYGLNYEFRKENVLKLEIEETDLLFLDTWHAYCQLKAELDTHSSKAKKYIIMHDTDVDGIVGETIRNGWDAVSQSEKTGFTLEEINCGLIRAIDEFLDNNKNWKMREKYNNNNGLTILERIN